MSNEIVYKGKRYSGIGDIDLDLTVTQEIPKVGDKIEATVDTTSKEGTTTITAEIPAGLQIENGLVVNDGNAVVKGDDITVEVERTGGYIDIFGDSGSRFIWKKHIVLMGKITPYNVDETELIESETSESKELYNTLDRYLQYAVLENVESPKKLKISGESLYASLRVKYKENTYTQPEGSDSVVNFIKPSDLYSKLRVNFNGSLPYDDKSLPYIKVESADMNYYYVHSYSQSLESSSYVNNTPKIKIPKNAKVIGMFLYARHWNETGCDVGLGIAAFDSFDDSSANLIAFIPFSFVTATSADSTIQELNATNRKFKEGEFLAWTSNSKEYNYAANITKRYSYIDKATYEASQGD